MIMKSINSDFFDIYDIFWPGITNFETFSPGPSGIYFDSFGYFYIPDTLNRLPATGKR